jgi:hypothetical protein
MNKKEKEILKKAVEDPTGLLSPVDLINGIAKHDRRAVQNLISKGYIEEVTKDLPGPTLGITYPQDFYRVTDKGLIEFQPWFRRFWFNFKKDPALVVGVASIFFGLVSSWASIYAINNSIQENRLKSQATYLTYSPNYNEVIRFKEFESDVKIENIGKITLHNAQPEFIDVYGDPNIIIHQEGGMESMVYDLKPGDFAIIPIPSKLKVKGKTILVKECYTFNDDPFKVIDNRINPVKLKEDPFYEAKRRFFAYDHNKCSTVFIKYNNEMKPIIIN